MRYGRVEQICRIRRDILWFFVARLWSSCPKLPADERTEVFFRLPVRSAPNVD